MTASSPHQPTLTMINSVAALIIDPGGRYLLQLRDDIPEIWFPDHWGLFGGAIDADETHEQALFREMNEELGIAPKEAHYFTRFDYDASFFGRAGNVLTRYYYVVHLPIGSAQDICLGEGRQFRFFAPPEILDGPRMTPYDSFVLWLHIHRHGIVYGDA